MPRSTTRSTRSTAPTSRICLDIHAPPDASQAAAAATAAHHVLVGLVPATLPQVTASLDGLYATSLGKIPDGKAKSDGIVVGAAAAAVMLADRLDDGRNGTRMFDVGTDPGEWRPVPPLSNNVFSWIGEVRPFSLKRPNQIRIPAPPPLKSKRYAREFNEVKALGAKTDSTRTPDQEALANWIVVNPFGPVNQTFRDLATSHGLSTAEQARLFAMTSLLGGRCLDQLLEQQGLLRVLAAADGHPGGGHGRQPEDDCRSRTGCRCSRRRATPTGRPATTASPRG